jgi:hypothetical protein
MSHETHLFWKARQGAPIFSSTVASISSCDMPEEARGINYSTVAISNPATNPARHKRHSDFHTQANTSSDPVEIKVLVVLSKKTGPPYR